MGCTDGLLLEPPTATDVHLLFRGSDQWLGTCDLKAALKVCCSAASKDSKTVEYWVSPWVEPMAALRDAQIAASKDGRTAVWREELKAVLG
jgi:hypothetical protein